MLRLRRRVEVVVVEQRGGWKRVEGDGAGSVGGAGAPTREIAGLYTKTRATSPMRAPNPPYGSPLRGEAHGGNQPKIRA